jgi:type VI secretion system protein ImpB
MAKSSSQKFISRNRAPRVQIDYDVELYGAQKKVELPFVMGVMADLSGNPAEPLAGVADRKFLEIDADNFDERLKASKPRVAFQVPNTLTGEGNIAVEMSFESMDDFSPAAVARKVDSLNKLLTARTQLANLLTYMDGKSGAEELVSKLLKDPALLQAVSSTAKPAQ